MNTELQILGYTCILAIIHVFSAAQAATSQTGLKYNMSPRDVPPPPLTGIAGRVSRASKNFFETFPIFVAATLLVQATQHNSALSIYGSQIYFVARLVYVPLYIAGIPGVRTLVWLASMAGIIMLIIAGL